MEKKIVLFMPSVEGGGVEKIFHHFKFFKEKIKIHSLSRQKNLSKKN